MNPFDLRGPEFLVFYILLSAVVALAVRHIVRSAEPEPGEPVKLTDPYLIAYMRGGAAEAVNVAVISLLDRELLVADGKSLERSTTRSAAGVTHTLEKAILGAAPGRLKDVMDKVEGILEGYRTHLTRQGLIVSPGLKAFCYKVWFAGLGVVLGAAGVKVAIGLSRGRPVEFLAILAGISAIAVSFAAFPRNTRRGLQTLAECRHLFSGLREAGKSWQPGSATPDLVMMAAVFGATAIPVAAAPYRQQLFGSPGGSSGDGGSSSSSCSSDSGSSCGGGGGCGGCGGGD